MLFSEEKKFVYIAVPKTGTTSLEQELKRIDPLILRNHIVLPDGRTQRVNKHITLKQVQALLGPKAGDYRYFGFVREPIDHTISKYFYYTTGRGYERFREGKIGTRALGLKVRFSRLIPRPLWFLFYPLNLQVSFIKDNSGNVALDFCGRTERLDSDMTELLHVAGYSDVTHQLRRLNSAPRREFGTRERSFIESILQIRLKEDLSFYATIRDGRYVS